ncbi:MAG: tetratricopeptide repeat protein [Planctomycetales bacterium]|nr:tetratricopeptide repeat protein [Planctomycetales bacterium]
MSSKRRSSRSVWKKLQYVFTLKWLRKLDLTSIDRVFTRRAKSIGRVLAPKWLTSFFSTLQKRLTKAERSVATAGKMVSQVVAESPLGEGAKAIAKKGKAIETQASRFILTSLLELLGALIPKPVRSFFQAIGKAFWRIFGVFFIFAGRWFKTRHYWQLIGGIPAFLLALPLAYCMVRMPFYGDAAKAQHYRSEFTKASEANDRPAADLYQRKLIQLNAFSERYEFQAALKEYENGDKVAALATIKRLADQTLYSDAMLWLAQHYMGDETKLPRPEALAEAQHYLNLLHERDPNNAGLRHVRAYYLMQTGKTEEAFDELAHIAEQAPSGRVMLAEAYFERGDTRSAQAELAKVVGIYEQKVADGSSLSAYEYGLWGFTVLLTGDLVQGQRILEEGHAQFPEDGPLKERLYKTIMIRARAMESSRRRDADEIALLQRACELQPDEQEPLVLLGQIAVSDGQAQTLAVTALETFEKSTTPPAQLNAVRGVSAAERGDFKTAVTFLRKACEENPEDARSHNNLAWVYLQLGDSSLSDALQLANRAVELAPDFPDYRETRGQVLNRLKRPAEAITDLMFALNGTPNPPKEIHEGLAEAYTQLGQLEQAAFHRQQAR